MEFPVNKNLTLADPGSDISVEIPAHHKNHVWPGMLHSIEIISLTSHALVLQ